jgi:hypothetical protein
LHRIEEAPNIYQPGILPPRLYQTNLFSRQQNDEEIDGDVYNLAADAMPATVEEIKQIEDDKANKKALSQTIKTFIVSIRAGRKRTAILKVIDNVEQAKQVKIAKTGGRGGRCSGGKV